MILQFAKSEDASVCRLCIYCKETPTIRVHLPSHRRQKKKQRWYVGVFGALGGPGTGKKMEENSDGPNRRIKESGKYTRVFSMPTPSDPRMRMAGIPAYLSTQLQMLDPGHSLTNFILQGSLNL